MQRLPFYNGKASYYRSVIHDERTRNTKTANGRNHIADMYKNHYFLLRDYLLKHFETTFLKEIESSPFMDNATYNYLYTAITSPNVPNSCANYQLDSSTQKNKQECIMLFIKECLARSLLRQYPELDLYPPQKRDLITKIKNQTFLRKKNKGSLLNKSHGQTTDLRNELEALKTFHLSQAPDTQLFGDDLEQQSRKIVRIEGPEHDRQEKSKKPVTTDGDKLEFIANKLRQQNLSEKSIQATTAEIETFLSLTKHETEFTQNSSVEKFIQKIVDREHERRFSKFKGYLLEAGLTSQVCDAASEIISELVRRLFREKSLLEMESLPEMRFLAESCVSAITSLKNIVQEPDKRDIQNPSYQG